MVDKLIERKKNKTFLCLVVFFAFWFLIPGAFAMLNPAAVYCEALGYTYEIQRTELGDVGLCVLPTGEKVDAWDFLEGKIAQEYSYCKREGYEIKTIRDDLCEFIHSDACAVCIVDGEEIEVTDLMGLNFEETYCGDGVCGVPENHKTCPEDCPSGTADFYCDGIADRRCDPDCLSTEDPDCLETQKVLDITIGGKKIKINIKNKTETRTELEINGVYVISRGKLEISKKGILINNMNVNTTPDSAVSLALQTENLSIKTVELVVADEKPFYIVKGNKAGKLFFLIPITMEIDVYVDAQANNITKITKPWWSSLVRDLRD